MVSNNHYRLIDQVMANSQDKTSWEIAVSEWEIVDHEEDIEMESQCVCGHEHLRYLFTIENTENGNVLFPIGSSCIKKFERKDLNTQTTVLEKLYQLHHAIEDGEYIVLDSQFFSKNLIKYLYEHDVFLPNQYNQNDSENDYRFLLKMFNKRYKEDITENQSRKIKALIMTIRAYLVVNLHSKTD